MSLTNENTFFSTKKLEFPNVTRQMPFLRPSYVHFCSQNPSQKPNIEQTADVVRSFFNSKVPNLPPPPIKAAELHVLKMSEYPKSDEKVLKRRGRKRERDDLYFIKAQLRIKQL